MIVIRRSILALVTGLIVAACSSASDRPARDSIEPTRPAPGHNVNDAAFLRLEAAHHGQAVLLADMALTKSRDRRVRGIARQVRTVQSGELTAMTRQLREWGATSDRHDHVHEPPGTLSGKELAELKSADGRDFDRYWLQTMALHEMAAHELAQVELERGRHPATRTLAHRFDAAQDRLTEDLLALLKTFPTD